MDDDGLRDMLDTVEISCDMQAPLHQGDPVSMQIHASCGGCGTVKALLVCAPCLALISRPTQGLYCLGCLREGRQALMDWAPTVL